MINFNQARIESIEWMLEELKEFIDPLNDKYLSHAEAYEQALYWFDRLDELNTEPVL